MNFIFVFYLVGLLVAVFQDFKRREIDDWLNLFLFFSGVGFLFFSGQLFFGQSVIIEFGFFIFTVCMLSFLLYHSRFFSGGDAKLLFALSPLFFSIIFYAALTNLFIFVVCLILCGCVYSLIYAAVLFCRDFRKTKVVFIKEIGRKYSVVIFIIGIMFIFLGFFYSTFIFFGLFAFLFIFLFSFARSLESVSMKKNICTKDLREGDWLFYDIRIGGRSFKKDWNGLSDEEIKFLKKFDKIVIVKDGIPYAPAFFLALILYYFSSYLLGMIFPQGF